MKISLTYQRGEALLAGSLISMLQRLFPGAKLHKSEHHPPFIHAYLTVRNPEKPSDKAGLR